MSKYKNAILCLITFALIFPVVSYAQDAKPKESRDKNCEKKEAKDKADKLKVNGKRIKEYIEWMARDEMEGRKTLTQGYRKAADWAADNFRKWGLEPAGEDGTYFQDVPIKRKFTYRTGSPELKIGSQVYLMEEDDFGIHTASTAATSVRAEVVFVGYGISAPDKELDEYAKMDVKNKIVLALEGSPWENPEPDDSETTDPWKDHVSLETKIKTAYDKGAAAILLYDPKIDDPQRSRYYYRRGSVTGDKLKFDRNFLAYTIGGRVLRAVMKTDKQESVRGFDRRLKAMKKDIDQKKTHSKKTGITVSLKGFDKIEEYSEEKKNHIARNVIARIKGTDPELNKQYVVMGGHLDHIGVRNGFVYNGADDNASGTAVVMEVARVLSKAKFKPKRTIIFCCWAGEELGLIGSHYYVQYPCASVSIDRVTAYFNMDMVGLGDTIGAPGALNFPTIWEVIKKGQDKDVISAVEPKTGGPGGSDHTPFIRKGIEALAIMTKGGDGHPSYHQPEDDTAVIDPEILYKTGQFVLQGTMNLANETEVELLIEDRQALYDGMRMNIVNINPKLKDSSWSYVGIEGYTPEKLIGRMAAVVKKPPKTYYKGIKDLKPFDGDVELLINAANTLGFGRVDIAGSDGEWIVKGRLTRNGRYAIRMMEENKIVINLVSPAPQLLEAVLETATRPFIITGIYDLNQQLYNKINEKNVLLGVKFNPAEVDDCVKTLDRAKAFLGDTDNLVVVITSTEGLDQAKQSLYVSLIKKGWQSDDINSQNRRERKGIAGGNLNILR